MVIKRIVTNANDAPKSRGRHPLLRAGSIHLMIYDFVRTHPGISSGDIVTQLNVNHQRISDLVNEGLLKQTGRSGRYRTFEVVPENETGAGAPKVGVEVSVYQTADGRYVAQAFILDEDGKRLPTYERHTGALVAQKRFIIPVTKNSFDPVGDIIDAEYEEIM